MAAFAQQRQSLLPMLVGLGKITVGAGRLTL